MVLDIASKYDIYGFNFDYIHYPSNQTARQALRGQAGGFSPSLYYDTLRSESAQDFSGAICLESDDGTDTQAEDTLPPPPLEVTYFYLVRADNNCSGEGSFGSYSDGTQRSGQSCP